MRFVRGDCPITIILQDKAYWNPVRPFFSSILEMGVEVMTV
jgi:hypothetical protein